MIETHSAIKNVGGNRNKTNHQRSELIHKTWGLVKKVVVPNLKLKTHHNCRYAQSEFFRVITNAAIHRNFAEGSCNDLIWDSEKASPSADTLLYHIKKFDKRELIASYEGVIENILTLAMKRGVFNKTMDVAIDMTEDLYYGDKNDPMVVGTKPKDGATRAFRYATLAVVEKDCKFTIKAILMDTTSTKKEIVSGLLQYARERFNINNVYLDRGFYAVDVISTLNKLNINYIMPAKQQPNIQKIFRSHEAPYICPITIGLKDKNTFAKLVITYDRNSTEKRAFITNMDLDRRDTRKLSDLYSKRWVIETIYRDTKQFRARTTSKNYIIRLFYFLFSVCVYDLWQLINLTVSESLEQNNHKKYAIQAIRFGNLLLNAFRLGGCGPPKRSRRDHRKRWEGSEN